MVYNEVSVAKNLGTQNSCYFLELNDDFLVCTAVLPYSSAFSSLLSLLNHRPKILNEKSWEKIPKF
jgi:hypothetical protein